MAKLINIDAMDRLDAEIHLIMGGKTLVVKDLKNEVMDKVPALAEEMIENDANSVFEVYSAQLALLTGEEQEFFYSFDIRQLKVAAERVMGEFQNAGEPKNRKQRRNT